MNPSLLLSVALIFASTVLTGCLTGNSPGGSPEGSPGGISSDAEKVHVGRYGVEGNRIIFLENSSTHYWCDGDEVVIDSVTDGPDTLTFDISGKTLSLYGGQDTLNSGAVLEGISIAQRVSGSGSHLEGAWTFSESKYRVISGTMTAEEKAESDEGIARWEGYRTYVTSTMEFSGGKVTSYIDANTAGRFTADWNGTIEGDDDSDLGPDSAKYSVVLNTIDRHTVELNGAITGETVRIKITPKGERTYTSDRAEHGQHVFLADAPTCPNDFQPDWYSAFLEDNAKLPVLDGAGKRGALDRNEKGRNSHRKWGVLPLPFR